MMRLLWQLRRLGLNLGLAGLAGCVLILAGLLGWLAVIVPLDQDLADKSVRLHTIETNHLQSKTEYEAAEMASSAWMHALPNTNAVPDILRRLGQLAHNEGLKLDQGQYRVVPVSGSKLLRWQARIPLQANYPALKAFIADSLEILPALTLDGFTLQRSSIDSTTLKCELDLSLYLQPES